MRDRIINMRLAVLKITALFCVMLAHIKFLPLFIFRLRQFDVILLVIVSGALCSRLFKASPISSAEYFKKRFLRLLVPSWIFLTGFFLVTRMLFLNREYPFSVLSMVKSFLFIGQVGHLRIIRIFLLLSISAPVLYKLRRFCKSNGRFLFVLLSIYGLYQMVYWFLASRLSHGFVARYIVRDCLCFLISYSCVFGVGMCIEDLRKRMLLLLGAVSFVVCAGFFFINNTGFFLHGSNVLVWVQRFKNPPDFYYVSYGLFVSAFLFCIVPDYVRRNSLKDRLIVFASTYSLQIYLWHVVFLYFWEWRIWGIHRLSAKNAFLEYIFILLFSVSATFLQGRVCNAFKTVMQKA